MHADGTSDPRSCWGLPSPWSALCFALGLSSLLPGNRVFDPEAPPPWTGDLTAARAVPVISGACMLVSRELWDRLGGFDPVFFLYGEDADFCLRAPPRPGTARWSPAGPCASTRAAGPRPARASSCC